MNVDPRGGAPIDLLVVHDPEGARTASELSNYLDGIGAGYNAIVDDNELIVKASDDLIVEGAGGVNARAVHICFIGFARWTRAEWLVHMPMLERGARWIAEKCAKHALPVVHLTPPQVGTFGVKGLCGHGDVSAAGYSASGGHTDPGPNFPWDVLLDLVRGTTAVPEDDEVYEDMIIKAPERQQRNPDRPASARLDIPNGRVVPMNGARLQQTNLTIVTPAATPGVHGWYETFNPDGSKKGFVVVGKRDDSGYPKYEFTWAKA